MAAILNCRTECCTLYLHYMYSMYSMNGVFCNDSVAARLKRLVYSSFPFSVSVERYTEIVNLRLQFDREDAG